MVDPVNANALWAVASPSTSTATSKQKNGAVSRDFAKILNEMKTGKIDTSKLQNDDEKQLSVVTRTMSDGSTVVMVMLGNKIVSERKFGGDGDKTENPKLVDQSTEVIGKVQPAGGSELDSGEQTGVISGDLFVNIQ